MRISHELEKGVICERCLKHVTKENYKRTVTQKPNVNDTTGSCKIIYRLNLCNDCYEEYKELVNKFIERK